MMRRAEILVTGHVQRVLFRYYTNMKADELGLGGTARNLTSGGIQIICEGAEEGIKKLIEWCKRGPEAAVVESVDVVWKEYTSEFKYFRVLY
jgi:acylphosphatase